MEEELLEDGQAGGERDKGGEPAGNLEGGIEVLEYSRGAIYRGRYTASQAALGVLEISRSAIYRGRFAASQTPLP